MKIIIIDGSEMTSRENAHAYLAEKLSLPAYYGGNLDALHDCLGDISENTHLIIRHCAKIEITLGSYGAVLLQIFKHSAEENDFLTLFLCDD